MCLYQCRHVLSSVSKFTSFEVTKRVFYPNRYQHVAGQSAGSAKKDKRPSRFYVTVPSSNHIIYQWKNCTTCMEFVQKKIIVSHEAIKCKN